MSAEVLTVAAESVKAAAEVVRGATLVARAKDLAQAHPIGAVAVMAATGAVVGGAVAYGGWKLMKKMFE